MVQGTRRKNLIMLIFGLMLLSVNAQAQKHDEGKLKQIRSMEFGEWNFDPDFYYWLTHKSYSGAEWYWKMEWFVPVPHIRFKETKSNVKKVGVPRAAQLPEEINTMNQIQHMIDSIEPLAIEETVRAIERNVDIVYPLYKSDFEELGNSISEALIYIANKGNGKTTGMCAQLQIEYDTILSEIEYIHKQGPGNEIEPTKRQLVYEDAKERLETLQSNCYKLARYVQTLY